MSREGRQLVEQAEALGWKAERTARHVKLTSPSGKAIVFMSFTSGDWRATRNCRAILRRTGEFDDRRKP
jgi:hypothetical protein